MEMGTLIFDIDGTLCTQEKNYADAKPIYSVIDKLNKKYDEGYKIVLFTARGTETGIDWREITEQQLNAWGVKYHDLLFKKPFGIQYIDDRGVNVHQWEQTIDYLIRQQFPWGMEYILYFTEQSEFKRLEIDRDKILYKQLHKYQTGALHIIEGVGTITINKNQQTIEPGQTIILQSENTCQIQSNSEKLVIIEVAIH